MRYSSTAEFWFASILTLITAIEIYPLGWYGRQAFNSHSHQAALEWLGWLVLTVLFVVTAYCCSLEWLLLRQRLVITTNSLTQATAVFCGGMLASMLTALWWSFYYF